MLSKQLCRQEYPTGKKTWKISNRVSSGCEFVYSYRNESTR